MVVIKPNSIMSQDVLYSVGRKAWNNCKNNIGRFSFKAKYTVAFCDGKLQLITNAENLPDEDTRMDVPNTLHIELGGKAQLVITDFLILKRYIHDSFAAALRNEKYQAAGQNYFEKANEHDWESVKHLGNLVNTFISNNGGVLATNVDGDPNMPGGFALQASTNLSNFQTVYDAFQLAEETTPAQQTKVQANNKVYEDLVSLVGDAATIAHNDHDAAFGRLFIIKVLRHEVDPKTAGAEGHVLSPNANQYEVGATLTFERLGHETMVAVTDSKGHYKKVGMAEGVYALTITKPNRVPIQTHITIKTETVSRFNFQMAPVPQPSN